jgi:hypothetical protein
MGIIAVVILRRSDRNWRLGRWPRMSWAPPSGAAAGPPGGVVAARIGRQRSRALTLRFEAVHRLARRPPLDAAGATAAKSARLKHRSWTCCPRRARAWFRAASARFEAPIEPTFREILHSQLPHRQRLSGDEVRPFTTPTVVSACMMNAANSSESTACMRTSAGSPDFDGDGGPVNMFVTEISGGLIQAIRSIINPDKLAHLGLPLSELGRKRERG